jgi:hypothetical protein
LWWKIDSSVSEPENFLPQLPYNERSQINQGLTIPLSRGFQRGKVLKLLPSVDAPHLNLTADDQAEQQTLCGARVGQRTLGHRPPFRGKPATPFGA